MIAEMKPGRYRQRNGGTATVELRAVDSRWPWVGVDSEGVNRWPWLGVDSEGVSTTWTDDGHHLASTRPDDLDLVEYLGPSEQTGETQ